MLHLLQLYGNPVALVKDYEREQLRKLKDKQKKAGIIDTDDKLDKDTLKFMDDDRAKS